MKAIYPGSFDPITRGHLDIIERSSKMYDEVIVVLMRNTSKNYLFSEDERLEMMKQTCRHLSNVKCVIGEGLSVNFAKKVDAKVMIRGLRAISDYDYEMKIALANMNMAPEIETVFLLAKPEYAFLSSTTIKELASYHENVSKYVGDYVAKCLANKFKDD